MPYKRHGSCNRRRRHAAMRRSGMVHQRLATTSSSAPASGHAQRAEKAQKSLKAS